MNATNQGPNPRRWLILAICCLSLLIVSMDVTIVNVALPSIEHDLHASVSGLQWTVDAYTLVLAVLLMLSGSTADRFGRRRVFQIGLTLFTFGSLLCSIAPGLGWLIAFRMLQAVGGSMLNPVAMSIIVNTFSDATERARAIGVWGGVVGVSLALGPVVGGVLVTGVDWRAIFWVNVPIGIAAVVLTQVFVPESKAEHARQLDLPAQILVIAMLGTLTYAIIEGPSFGWHSLLIISLFIAAAVALGALVVVEQHRREPLIDVRFFRSAPFSGATLAAIAAFAALGGFLFLNTLYLQDVRHYSALDAGLLTIPMAVMTAVFAPLSGRLVGSRGPRLPLIVAGFAIAISSAVLVTLTTTTPIWLLIVVYVGFGLGFGLVNAPISNTAMNGMPREQAGVAAAVASTARQIGSSLGVAITGSLVAATAGIGFVMASHAAWGVISASGAIVVAVGLLSTGTWAAGTAARTRELLQPEEEVPGERSLVAAR